MGYFLLVFFLGACVGSFVNVLIDRTIAHRTWMTGRSVCDHCKRKLVWYDMIPIVSYLLLRGRSRCCHKPLTPKHVIVEVLFGTLFVWWLMIGFAFFRLASAPLSVIQPVFWLGIGTILMILAIADWVWGVILMRVLWVGVAWVVLYRLLLTWYGVYQLDDLIMMFGMGAMAFLFIWFLRFITQGRGMGDGDPYLVFLTAILVGWPRGIVAVLSAFVIGAVVGMVLLSTGVRRRNETIPFGPFIVAGAFVALLWGEQILKTLYGI